MAIFDVDIVKVPEAARVSLEKWAQITIEKWEFNVVKFKLIHTTELLRSFQYTVNQEAGGDKALISFAFKYYLRMLEMGVGRGAPIGADSSRKRYSLFTKTFQAELYRLTDLLSKMYANQGAALVAFGIAK